MLKISINQRLLIDLARSNSGLRLADIGEKMGLSQSRISEWRSGKYSPNSDQVAYLAHLAGLPVLETVAALSPPWAASLWKSLAKSTKSANSQDGVALAQTEQDAAAVATTKPHAPRRRVRFKVAKSTH